MKNSILALALFAALPMAASAADKPLNYNYVEGGYVRVDNDANGAFVRGSANFGQSSFYGFGEYSRADINSSPLHLNQGELGLGYHYGISNNTDFIGEVAYANVGVGGFGGSVNFDGYRVGAGVRSALSSNFVGSAKVNYRDYSGTGLSNGDASLALGGELKMTQNWSAVAEAEVAEHDNHTYKLGFRYNF